MQYSLPIKVVGKYLDHLFIHDLDKTKRQEVLDEYRAIVERAKDIGSKNRLLSSYILAAYFIALSRKSGMDNETCIKLMEDHMRSSKALKLFMGDSKSYFSEKNMASRYEWSKETHQKKYANDWVVDVLPKCDAYQFGFNYLECGVCKLCRDEKCPELAKYLCSLDYMLVDMMGIKLERTKTLAQGDELCDFRFIKK